MSVLALLGHTFTTEIDLALCCHIKKQQNMLSRVAKVICSFFIFFFAQLEKHVNPFACTQQDKDLPVDGLLAGWGWYRCRNLSTTPRPSFLPHNTHTPFSLSLLLCITHTHTHNRDSTKAGRPCEQNRQYRIRDTKAEFKLSLHRKGITFSVE